MNLNLKILKIGALLALAFPFAASALSYDELMTVFKHSQSSQVLGLGDSNQALILTSPYNRSLNVSVEKMNFENGQWVYRIWWKRTLNRVGSLVINKNRQNPLVPEARQEGSEIFRLNPKQRARVEFFSKPNARGALLLRKYFTAPEAPAPPEGVIFCEYAAPPVGCTYEPGPAYDPETGCGLIMKCPVEPTEKSLRVIAPNGGENWRRGKAETIVWSKTDAISAVDIYLAAWFDCWESSPSCMAPARLPLKIAGNISGTSFAWTVSDKLLNEAGFGQHYSYKIQITAAGAPALSDLSDKSFLITGFDSSDYCPTATCPTPPASYYSLLSAAAVHLKDAQAIAPDAELFEAETLITAEEINTGNIRLPFVFSSFVQPGGDAEFIRVNEWLSDPAKRNYTASKHSFIVRECNSPAPPPEFRCGGPTGEAEPRAKHLPMNNWTKDIKEAARILKEEGMGVSRGGKILATTIGRLKSKYPEYFPQSLAQLPDAKPVIEFIETEAGSASTNFSAVGQYVVLDAADGKVLAKGGYKLPSPLQ